MTPDVTLNGISMSGLGWLRESISFPAPEPQTNTIVVPGRSAPIRYTEALGRVSYKPRSFQVTLSMLGDRMEYNRMANSAVNRFAGQLAQVILSEESGLYYVGTVQLATSYDPKTGKGTLVVSCEDGDAYRYHTAETVVTASGGTSTLTNDYMPVVPSITTTNETTFRWQVGTDVFTKTVSAGSWVFPELQLGHGETSVSITTSGAVTFRYREGRL